MPERITSSSELRGFVADNTGRRKIDTEASLELHVRAATQIDLLSQELTELEQQLESQPTAPAPAPAATAPQPPADPSSSAMILLRNAQIAADETLAEAADMRAKAAAALADAEATASARAEEATAGAMARAQQAVADAQVTADRTLAEARNEAERLKADAQADADRIVRNARAEADSIAAANTKVRDRAEFIQRQYLDKAGIVRREAEALADFSRQVETFAKSDMVLPPFDPEAVDAPADDEATASHAAPVTETPPEPETVTEVVRKPDAPEPEAHAPHPATRAHPATGAQESSSDPHLALVADAPDDALPPPPPPPPPIDQPAPVAAHASSPPAAQAHAAAATGTEHLPPPPPPDMLDLTDDELADVLEGRSIDDELFDDDDVIDLTKADADSDNFQFFGRD